MNTLGTLLRFTCFGESHGAGVGGVLDGFPAGIAIDESYVQSRLDRRRPGQSTLTTARNETDRVEILSGVFEGRSTGTPIAFLIRNKDQHSNDYAALRQCFRPSHADYTYQAKYGVRDHRGGGRSSARATAAHVCAGALAQLALREVGIDVLAWTSQIGDISLPPHFAPGSEAEVERSLVRCPDPATAKQMEELVEAVKREGDTIGGVVSGRISGSALLGLGEPLFGKLQARLAAAMLSINAAKGFEYGDGFAMAARRGSEVADAFYTDASGHVRTHTNHSGGLQGGIANGEDITFRVAFKPVATLLRPQASIDVNGQPVTLNPRGRHDPCVLPRAVPIVEAMAALIILDCFLISRANRL